MEHLSSISYAVRKGLLARGASIPLGHVQQLMVAALGHNNLASYQASDEDAVLPNAKAVAFDNLLLAARAAELGADDQAVTRVLIAVLQERFPDLDIHESADSLVEEWHLYCETSIADDDRVNSETAMTNGTFPQAQDVDLPWWEGFGDFDGDLIHQHEGVVTVDQDPDRVYWGDEVDVRARITVERFGRRLFGDCEVRVESAKLRWLGHSDESPEPVE